MIPKWQIKSLLITCDLITAKLNQEVDIVYDDIMSWDTYIY